MVDKEDRSEGGKPVDASQLPVRILHTDLNKWKHGSERFDFPPNVTRFRLEFVCFVGDKSENLDVDISAILFDAKGGYVETVGYGCPSSTDGGIVHKHDSVQPEAGKIAEDIDFDLAVVHKRIFSACLLATTYGNHTFASLRSIQLRILAPSHLLSDSLEREIARIMYTREGCFGRKYTESSSQSRRSSVPNVLVLGDIRRLLSQTAAVGGEAGGDGGPREAGAWNLRAPNVIASHIDTPHEAIPLVQCYLREWIPSIEVIGQELLIRRVYDIVSFLPLGDLEVLRSHWVEGGTSGVTKELFLENMLRVLLQAHATLRDERQRLELTSLLSDLFDQISGSKSVVAAASAGFGSGNDTLAWEQFTTFWVEAATINTHSQAVRCWADETLQWEMDSRFELAVRKPTKFVSLPLMHLIVGLEERGSFVSVLNGVTGRLHATLCPSSLQTVTTGGIHPQDSFLTVLDVECVDTKGIVIISSTDHAISVWMYNHGTENAIWRFSMHSRSAQILIRWVAHERGFLVSAGVDHVVTAWCVDKQLRLAVMQGHRARVTGVTYIPQHGQFATCSFDKTVRLWDADNFTPVAEMKRRSPIKFVESRGDLVLCITLEVEAHVLSVSTRRLWCRLIGHNHLIIGAAMVHFVDARQGRQTRTITGDQMGEFFIWDIGNGQAKNGCAEVMQTFSVYTWRPNLGEIAGFERFHRHLSAVNGSNKADSKQYGDRSKEKSDTSMSHVWPDILVRGVGGTIVVRTRQLIKDARAANVLVYNDKSMDLIASTGQHLRFWNLQTSDPLRMITSPCPLGITAMATDKPDPKRIYLGTSDGGIAVVHIVTGQLLFEVKSVHNGAVALLVVCSASREVVSVGIDRRVAVHRETPKGLGLVLAGGIEETHKAAISACAVSQEAQLIATAAGGEIRLWHKQDLSFQGGISDLDADVLGLVFLPSTACLLASDSGGDVVLWVAEFDKAGVEPQRDVDARESRSAPAWEADAKFTAAETDEKRGGGDDAAHVGAKRSVDRSAEGVGKAGIDLSETAGQPTTELLLAAILSSGSGPVAMDGEGNQSKGEGSTLVPPDVPQKKRTAPAAAANLRHTGPCALRPAVLLSGRPAHEHTKREEGHDQSQEESQESHLHHHPSPVYEIHLHSMYEDYAPAATPPPQNGNPGGKTEGAKGDESSAEGAAETAEQSEERSSGWPPSKGAGGGKNSYPGERRTKLVVIIGSAGGWVEVWEAEGLLAAAGVDEEAMAARLLRRQPPERGSHIRATRHRRCGLTCFPPSASVVLARGSAHATVRGILEGLDPIPPSLRWEAHHGSPVSTLCALEKTPLVATASTDSTVRLFTLADIQVGAQPFLAAGLLGEINMRDTESVRIDRAEMWSCPSLNAADVRPAAEIAAYRLLSKNICAEVEEQMNPGPPTCVPAVTPPTPTHAVEPANLVSVGGHQKRTDAEEKKDPAAQLSRGRSADLGLSIESISTTPTVEGQTTGHLPDVAGERDSSPNRSTSSTFLTAVQQPDVDKNQQKELVSRRESDGTGGHGAPDDRPARAATQPAAAEHESSNAGGHGAMDSSTAQTLNVVGAQGSKHAKSGDECARPKKAQSETATEGETSHVVVESGARRGPGRLWDRGRAPSDSFDKQRVTLTSARAAKNHLGKTLYGNMYNEIKSGAACNTLVTEYVLRKNSRGDAEIDTEETPFLRDNLKEKIPSLAKRKRRRQRRLAASNPAAVGKKSPMPSTKPDTDEAAHDAAAFTEYDQELPNKAGGVGEGNLAEQRVHPDCEKVMQDVGGEGRPHQARSASGSPNGIYSGHHDESDKQGKRLPRRLDLKKPSGLAESGGSSGEGHNPTENQSRFRIRDRAGDIQSKYSTDVKDPHRGRHGGRRRQEAAGRRPMNGETGPIFAGRSVGEGRRRRAEEITKNSPFGDRVSASSPRLAGEVDGRRRQQITTSASLETLSLRDMEEREGGSRSKGNVDDALDSLLHLKLEPGKERTLTKCASLPSAGLQERWKQMLERFDSAISPSPLDGPPTTTNWSKVKSQTRSTVGAYIRRKPDRSCGSLASGFEETDEALLSVANFGTYSRAEVETLGGVFLAFAREGDRVTYDMWRKAIMSNSGVKMLKGLQFGMLDEDNDGEVSLSDISRAVFRRAGDRDISRIRKFLELWLNRERQKYHRRQVCKVLKETRVDAVAAAETTSTRGRASFTQPVSALDP